MLTSIHIPFIELSSLTLLLLMLYWMKRSIGILPVYLLLGLFFIFGHITLLPALNDLLFDIEELSTLTYGLLLLPVVMMYLIIYEMEDTLEAQRFLFGMVVTVIAFIYISQLILGQFGTSDVATLPQVIKYMMFPRFFYMPLVILTVVSILILLVMPISYQFFRNLRIPVILCMFVHIVTFVFISLAMRRLMGTDRLPPFNPFTFISWLLSALLVSALASIYISLNSRKRPVRRRSPLGILSTLMGHIYTSSKVRQSVEEWEERYQAVFDNTIEMILLVDESGAVINANHAAVSTFGPLIYSSGYIIVNKITDEKENPIQWRELWNELHTKKKESTLVFSDMLLAMEDGRKLNIDYSVAPVGIYDIPMAIFIIRDTTKEHLEKQERRRLEENLMHSQRLEALGILAGGIAHDFNNLIFGIQTSAEIISRQELTPQTRAMLGNIENATTRAADLTSKLLGFARKGKYQEQLLDVTAIANDAATLFRIGLKEIDFRLLVEPGAFIILGDATQLQQVLLNILINAKDALTDSNAQTRKITLRIDRATAELPAWKQHPQEITEPSKYVAIRIKDTGAGMDEETLAHVFDPFYTTKEHKGTGLGLAMAYGCITHHHGWISIASQQGKGTEVTIILPLAK